jgi:hypothetical protein
VFFGAERLRVTGRWLDDVLRSGASASILRMEEELEGQCAAKAVAATGRGNPLRVSNPWTDSA